METINLAGINIKYIQRGSKRKSPLVFIHNGGNDHHIWDYQLDFFAEKYRVYAFDLPGFGMSDKPDRDYTLDFFTEILDLFLQEMDTGPAVLIGNCIGSAMSLNLSMLKPEKVKGLVLFNVLTEKILKAGHFGFLTSLTGSLPPFRIITEYLSRHIVLPSWYIKKSMKLQYGLKKFKDPEYLPRAIICYKNREQLRALYRVVMNISSFGKLDNLSVKDVSDNLPPLCVLWGEKNRILPVRAAQDLLDTISPRLFHTGKDCGHLYMREAPEEVHRIIGEFLGGL